MIPFIVVSVVIALDQISKYIVYTAQPFESFNFIPYILNITYTTNTGASFGILKNHRWVFMSLSTVALVLMAASIIYLMRKKIKNKNMIISVALALMLGGGFGNMIDRVLRGYVVDFLEFDFVNFAIFNIADTFICIGSVLLCICVFMGKYSLFITPVAVIDKPMENAENTENIESAGNMEN